MKRNNDTYCTKYDDDDNDDPFILNQLTDNWYQNIHLITISIVFWVKIIQDKVKTKHFWNNPPNKHLQLCPKINPNLIFA